MSLEDLRFLSICMWTWGCGYHKPLFMSKSSEVAFARMTGREDEESPVSLQYLQLIHFCYENFVSHLLNMGCQSKLMGT